jgi:endonuclease/exonuclease/phosphatase family metal-dependent hydrolase
MAIRTRNPDPICGCLEKGDAMRVMTFNIRFENERDGPNGWIFRRRLVARVIERYRPTVLGTQEGKSAQLTYLRDFLPEYEMHTPGRVWDGACQYPTLFILHQRCEALEGAEFWLSERPEIHRSKSWDSAFPRMMSYAKLWSTEDKRPFWVAVTHLDHMGVEARFQQARRIARWVQGRKSPVILMGDFNEGPEEAVHQMLTGPDTGLKDTWQMMGHPEDSKSPTHHGFRGIPQKKRIDWVLVSAHFVATECRILNDRFGDRYPSDHFPYMVDLRWL